MEVSNVASLSSSVAQMKVGDSVGISVLKKAMEIEAQGVLQYWGNRLRRRKAGLIEYK